MTPQEAASPPSDAVDPLQPFGPVVARFDAVVDGWLERWRGHGVPDTVFRTASHAGDFSLLWHGLGAALAIAAPRRARQSLRLSLLLGVESLVVNQGIKRLFARTRPTETGDDRLSVRKPLTSSFPSGHASSGFFAATLLSRMVPALRPVWYGLAAVVATSRAYVRIHHASDVIAGAVVGRLLGAGAERLWPSR